MTSLSHWAFLFSWAKQHTFHKSIGIANEDCILGSSNHCVDAFAGVDLFDEHWCFVQVVPFFDLAIETSCEEEIVHWTHGVDECLVGILQFKNNTIIPLGSLRLFFPYCNLDILLEFNSIFNRKMCIMHRKYCTFHSKSLTSFVAIVLNVSLLATTMPLPSRVAQTMNFLCTFTSGAIEEGRRAWIRPTNNNG